MVASDSVGWRKGAGGRRDVGADGGRNGRFRMAEGDEGDRGYTDNEL